MARQFDIKKIPRQDPAPDIKPRREPNMLGKSQPKINWLKRGGFPYLPFIIILASSFALIAKVFFYKPVISPSQSLSQTLNDLQNLKKQTPIETQTPAPPSTPNVSPESQPAVTTPPPTIDKSTIKITILNGSRENGLAAQDKKVLEEAGFKVSSIGNTQNLYTKSFIYYNTGKLDQAKLVNDALKDRTYTLEENPSLAGSNDLLVVIGKE